MLESDLPTISHPHQLTFIVDLLALISELLVPVSDLLHWQIVHTESRLRDVLRLT